ncbi:MAG TPA: GNAT family N-acetyltransferase [Gaiellaceae bacterium]|nr:GNAT family N-acetyltransferase [Gaiellaceae bacterium]
MAARPDGWLAERFGCPVFTVDGAASEEDVAGEGRRFYQARVAVDDVEAVRRLAALGFAVVDTTLTLGRLPELGWAGSEVVHAEPAQREAVVEIARSSFRWSRFHLDPEVPDELANRIKADWIESYFAGTRGEHLLVALADGEPAGFLAVIAGEEEGRTLRTIDLIAVAEHARGRGLARALTAAFVAESAAVCDEVRVGTQAANVAATRLYESLGFSLVRAQYALHLHAS